MSNVKVIRVIQVGRSRYSTIAPACDAVAWEITHKLWRKFRDKFYNSGENYEAMHRLEEKAKRRVTGILERALAS